ncbi:hypothetical protein PAPYR_7868 [Paratrimastix pyriformis]|uniref:Uncharacterized protein n=1 Tax=Paratrimastix pyriformis TaxID=342808 RepID=A0ABQ8UFV6_9EUKA|nr:hypothetical protein PAPYR_7868 [Paratrimastix pyriformis]
MLRNNSCSLRYSGGRICGHLKSRVRSDVQKHGRYELDSLRNTFSAYQCFRFYLNKIHLMLSSIHEKTTLRNTIDI